MKGRAEKAAESTVSLLRLYTLPLMIYCNSRREFLIVSSIWLFISSRSIWGVVELCWRNWRLRTSSTENSKASKSTLSRSGRRMKKLLWYSLSWRVCAPDLECSLSASGRLKWDTAPVPWQGSGNLKPVSAGSVFIIGLKKYACQSKSRWDARVNTSYLQEMSCLLPLII